MESSTKDRRLLLFKGSVRDHTLPIPLGSSNVTDAAMRASNNEVTDIKSNIVWC